MINKIKTQTLQHLEKIQQTAMKLSQTHDDEEAKQLYATISHECFQARTLVEKLSFVVLKDNNKDEEVIEEAMEKQEESNDVSEHPRKKYVLIAEYVDHNYLLEQLVLKNHYRVERAKNGREAIEMVERECPDIVLMDIMMPVMNGCEACDILKAKYPSLPIIAVTAYTQVEEEAKIMKHPFDGFLPKPLKLATFTKVVAEKLKVS